MLSVAICDDEEASVSRNERIVRSCLDELRSMVKITAYTRSNNLLWDIADDRIFYDLILLDIEMPGIDGMEMVQKIKPFLPNVKVIFITSHMEYAIDAFELSIFRYVPKNELENRLRLAVRDAVRLLELEGGKAYTISNSSRLVRIAYKEIFFIERDGKNACITYEGGTAKVRKSLQQVFEELGSEEFLYIDRGYIVNLIHIIQIKGSEAHMKNGAVLPVSRSHLQEVKEKVNAYWGKHI